MRTHVHARHPWRTNEVAMHKIVGPTDLRRAYAHARASTCKRKRKRKRKCKCKCRCRCTNAWQRLSAEAGFFRVRTYTTTKYPRNLILGSRDRVKQGYPELPRRKTCHVWRRNVIPHLFKDRRTQTEKSRTNVMHSCKEHTQICAQAGQFVRALPRTLEYTHSHTSVREYAHAYAHTRSTQICTSRGKCTRTTIYSRTRTNPQRYVHIHVQMRRHTWGLGIQHTTGYCD